MTTEEVIALLKQHANPDIILQKEKKFGVKSRNALGIYHKELKEIARTLPKNPKLANDLFDSDIYEARLLCSKLLTPEDVTDELLEKWVRSFENWEICDSFCMGLVAKSKFAVLKIFEWSSRKNEFEKRAAFTTIAAYCMANKHAPNDQFMQFMPLIMREACDKRLYVKKAVNWALRNIGKRNSDLKTEAESLAQELKGGTCASARWIGADALRELQKKNVRISNYPRSLYQV